MLLRPELQMGDLTVATRAYLSFGTQPRQVYTFKCKKVVRPLSSCLFARLAVSRVRIVRLRNFVEGLTECYFLLSDTLQQPRKVFTSN